MTLAISLPRHATCLLVLACIACGSPSSNAPDAPGMSSVDCLPVCTAKARACGAPADRATQECTLLCPSATTPAQLTCLEGASCTELIKLIDHTGTVCDIGTPPAAGKFGDPCKCNPDGTGGGEFDCSGTNICSTGLRCIGSRIQGVDRGTCRGPVCCTGTAECATVLGQQGRCATDQKCSCIQGIECVGDACTCLGGVPATEGLCYPAS